MNSKISTSWSLIAPPCSDKYFNECWWSIRDAGNDTVALVYHEDDAQMLVSAPEMKTENNELRELLKEYARWFPVRRHTDQGCKCLGCRVADILGENRNELDHAD